MKTTTALLVYLQATCLFFFSPANAKIPSFQCPIQTSYLEDKLSVSEVEKYCIKGIKKGSEKDCDACIASMIPRFDAGILANIDFQDLMAYAKDTRYTLTEKLQGVYESCDSKFRRALRRKGVSDKDVLKFRSNLESCSWNLDRYPETTAAIFTIIENSLGAFMQLLG